MGKWIISKEFDFCYGHRVWSQTLNKEYSIDNRCVCRHLHGHQGKIIVTLESGILEQGMVTDFKHLNWFKKFLDDVLDHKFIIDKHDPMFGAIVPCNGLFSWQTKPEGYSIVDPNFFKTITVPGMIEILEGFVFVDFVPTSENLSAWLYKIVDDKMKFIGVDTKAVHFFETPKSSSKYECS